MIKEKKQAWQLLLIVPLLYFSSCEQFQYTRYDIIIDSDETDLINKNLNKLLIRDDASKKQAFSFAFITDSQNFFDRLTKGVSNFNEREDCEFAIIGGDITEYSLPAEFKLSVNNLKNLDQPFLNVIGNHDALGVGKEMYSKMFGAYHYAFIYKRIKFIILNTNSREFGLTGKVPNVSWLESELRKTDKYDFAIVAAHSGALPNDDNLDQRLFPELDRVLSNAPHLLAMIHGHGHSENMEFPLTNEKIPVIEVGAIANKRYSVFRINEGVLTQERIKY